MAVTMYYDQDASMDALQGKTVAVMGYGSQGHAQAQNLKDSGVKVIVGLKKGSKRWKEAEEAGLQVMTVPEAAKQADIIQVLIPDEKQAEVYKNEIEPYLQKGNALCFSHGFNIHFGQIQPPSHVDVFMVAPKGPGHLVRRVYVEGGGVPSYWRWNGIIPARPKKSPWRMRRHWGHTRRSIGNHVPRRNGNRPHFGEQCVLCGGISGLIRAGFDTLVEADCTESAYF